MTTKEPFPLGFLLFVSGVCIYLWWNPTMNQEEMAIAKFEKVDRIGYGKIISGIEKLPNGIYRAIVKTDDRNYSCIVREGAKEGQWVKICKVTFPRRNCDNSDSPLFFATPAYGGEDDEPGDKLDL